MNISKSKNEEQKNIILPYTFYSNPFKEQLGKIFDEVFVFCILTEDLPKLLNLIHSYNPTYILGVAKFKYRIPQFEHTAVNKFHKTKRVSKTGPERYKLFAPNLNNTSFRIASRPSDTFCNWTMYKIANFLDQKKMDTKLMFVHMKERDLNDLVDIIKKLV